MIKAKVNKQTALEHEEKLAARRQASDKLLKPFTEDQLIDFCYEQYKAITGKKFEVDTYNGPLFYMLAKYFTNNTSFEVGDYKLNKGLLIMGQVGTGKTELMRFFQKNKKCCYTIKPCNDVAGDLSVYKDEIDHVYSTPIERPLHDPATFFQKYIGYCFDDLGTEDVKNYFGNKKNVMADVLLAIYNKKNYSCFHLTTNLASKEEITEKYGTRVNSRLREMFNVFVLDGIDRRK